jgi:hypothetical protein
MLFEKSKLASLKKAIASKHGTNWYSAIMRNMNKSKQFAFSEFETYGNFLYSRNPRGLILKKALNKSLSMNVREITSSRVRALSAKYRSISFHKRKGYAR